jgi:hypothetical protein
LYRDKKVVGVFVAFFVRRFIPFFNDGIFNICSLHQTEIGGRNSQGEIYSEIGGRNSLLEFYSVEKFWEKFIQKLEEEIHKENLLEVEEEILGE